MGQTNVSIRMDNELKEQFSAFCTDMGMTMTTAFNIFAKKAVREYRIPFEIGAPRPNAETQEALDEVRRMKEDPSLGKRYTDVDEMMKDLEPRYRDHALAGDQSIRKAALSSQS